MKFSLEFQSVKFVEQTPPLHTDISQASSLVKWQSFLNYKIKVYHLSLQISWHICALQSVDFVNSPLQLRSCHIYIFL